MHETALDTDGRPDFSKGTGKGRISVNGSRHGHEATSTEVREGATECTRMLAYPVRTEDNCILPDVHDHERTGSATLDEGSINDDAEHVPEIGRLLRRTIQPVSDDTLYLPRAVPTLIRELSDRVSLDEPTIKPDALSMEDVRSITPDECSTARSAAPAMCSSGSRTPSFNVPPRTAQTSFFSAYC